MKLSTPTLIKIIVISVYVLISIILTILLTNFKSEYYIGSELYFEKYSKLYDVIDEEKNITAKIKDLILISDVDLKKSESTELNLKLSFIIEKLDFIKKNETSADGKELLDKVLSERNQYYPIQKRIIDLFQSQPQASDLVILYGDMNKVQKQYFQYSYELKDFYKDKFSYNFASSSTSFTIILILYYLFLLSSLLICGYLIFLLISVVRKKENMI